MIATSLLFASALLVKTSGTGYTTLEWSRYESCEVYLDHAVITRHYGIGFETTEQRQLTISAGIADAIRLAAAEPVESTDNGLCDGPSTSITAQADGDQAAVELFSTGGCGTPKTTRNGPASYMLRDVVDQFCSTTHQ
jgi:hypothetical protein